MIVSEPAASSYDNDMPVPAVSNAPTLSSTLSFVKYRLDEPSVISSVLSFVAT